MAELAQIVDELLREFGKSSPTVRDRTEMRAGEVVREMLSQNDGRFEGLRKSISFSVLVDVKKYRLPSDFNTVSPSFNEVDSDGDVVARCHVVQKGEIFDNIEEGGYVGKRQAYIEYLKDGPDGRGLYLVFGDEMTETIYYEMDYYRKATENDADMIRSDGTIKDGVRGKSPEYVPDAGHYAGMYAGKLRGFKESPRKRTTTIGIQPSKRVQSHNRRMHNIGGGG